MFFLNFRIIEFTLTPAYRQAGYPSSIKGEGIKGMAVYVFFLHNQFITL